MADALLIAVAAVVLLALIGFWLHTNARLNAVQAKLIESGKLQEGTAQSFGQIQHTLGRLSEASRHMEQVGKEIAGLSDLLRAPKLRGGVGELLLGDLLGQMLTPEQFHLNHSFKSGERVDAIISLQAGMVPVDSKFPLESFQRLMAAEQETERAKHKREFARAVKKHVDDIARKYIVPDEGTFDFALMYIPAENVYYETIIKDEALGDDKGILSHALEKRVIPVSPNSFYAYLQAIALGLRGMQIEQQAKQIMAHLARLEGDFGRFREAYDTLGGHLDRARSKYEEANRSLGRFEEKLMGARQPADVLPSGSRGELDAPGDDG